ncbi:hypothetical protein BKA62DRAFT_689030 [Auriculariales sp. MPI-PUGE-AT-0066]|nr:hypothetical protein BKA62DRAFT_689030 [Auriculariales sp. MPI-PUGE-AT-0066]
MSQRKPEEPLPAPLPPQYVPRSHMSNLSYKEKYERQRVKYDYQLERQRSLIQSFDYAIHKQQKLGDEIDLLLDSLMGYRIVPPPSPEPLPQHAQPAPAPANGAADTNGHAAKRQRLA